MAGRFSKEQVAQFLQAGDVKNMADVQSALKDLFGCTLATGQALEALLQSEMDAHLGYAKGEAQSKQADNRRNGHRHKSVRSEYGEVELTGRVTVRVTLTRRLSLNGRRTSQA